MDQKVSIIKTLVYHDIFQYPLTAEEIRSYLISSRIKIPHLQKQLKVLMKKGKIESSKGYYFLKNKKSSAAIRISRQKNSINKFKKANFYAKILKLVPLIQMVAVSGALAMGNSHKRDDIDLVIIAKTRTLWTTRLFATFLLFPFKRKPGSKKTDNRACLNLFLDESDLKINPQNIYLAHEICQMKPLWSRDNTYSRFIAANSWVFKYLPNWEPSLTVIPAPASPSPRLRQVGAGAKRGEKAEIRNSRGVPKKALVVSRLALVAEIFAKKFQLFYMRKKISTERIREHQLFFHPSNTQEKTLKEYQKRISSLVSK